MNQSFNSITASCAFTRHARIILPALTLAMMWGCNKTEEKPAQPPAPPQAIAPAAAPVAPAPAAPAPQMTAEAQKAAEMPKTMEAVQPKPAAAVAAETKPAAAAPTSSEATANGEKFYKSACMACHQMGIAGAPKVGDKADWGPRIKQGKDVLYKRTIEGFKGQKGMMPPRGGSMLKDDQIRAAVDYMIGQSQ